jgi:hypothetical protein
MTASPLVELLLALSGPAGDSPEQAHRVQVRLAEDDLDGPSASPAWLLDLLTALRDGRQTDWLPLPRPETDDTNVFDFIRGLPDILPVEYENNEESWMLRFPDRDLEACISLEGSVYKVGKTGTIWD